jgi:hypothetical protein
VVVQLVVLAMQIVEQLAMLVAKLAVAQLAMQVELVVGQLFDRSNSIVVRPIGQLAIQQV